MREIKVRGMDLQGRWFYGNLAIIPKDTRDHKAGHCISNSAGMPFAYRVRPETVGQYTGMKDKNGIEIYEGDVVKGKTYLGNMEVFARFIGRVKYRAPKYEIDGVNKYLNCREDLDGSYEIIGNIFESNFILELARSAPDSTEIISKA